MATLIETVEYLRSKNAGPFEVTFDIFCGNANAYEQVKNSPNITPQLFARIYKVPEDKIDFYYLPDLKVVKISIPRPVPQGDKMDRDQHQCQQALLLYGQEV